MRFGSSIRFPIAILSIIAVSGLTAKLGQIGPRKPTVPAVTFQKFRFDNGLTLVVGEEPHADSAAVQVWYKAGSRDEAVGRNGLAHLAEHLMFESGAGGEEDFFELARDLGATECNGVTGYDTTRFLMTVPTASLERALWLESKRMGGDGVVVDEDSLDRARNIVANEIRQKSSLPRTMVDLQLASRVFPGRHPYSRPAMGSVQDLADIQIADARDWIGRRLAPSNATLVVVGDVNTDLVVEWTRRYFGGLSAGRPIDRDLEWIPAAPPRFRSQLFLADAQPELRKAWIVPGYASIEADYLDIFRAIAQQRLRERLVEEDRSAVSVEVLLSANELCGLFEIRVRASPTVDPWSLDDTISQELSFAISSIPTPRQLRQISESIADGWRESLGKAGQPVDRASLLGLSEVMGHTPDHYRSSLSRIFSASGELVVATARRWLGERSPTTLQILRPPEPNPASLSDRRDSTPTPPMKALLPTVVRTTLPNGLVLVRVARPAADQAFLSLCLQTPPPAQASLARITLETITYQLKDRTRKQGLVDWQAPCDFNLCCATVKTSVEGWKQALADLSSLPWTDTVDPEFFRSFQRQLLARLDLDSDPRSLARPLLDAILGGTVRLGADRSVSGELTSLRPESAVELLSQWLEPGRAVVAFVGPSQEGEFESEASRLFSGWSGSKPRAAPPRQTTNRPQLVCVDRPGMEQMALSGGKPLDRLPVVGARAFHAVGAALDRSLNRALRREKQWSYRAEAELVGDARQATLVISMDASTGVVAEAISEAVRLTNSLPDAANLEADEVARLDKRFLLGLSGPFLETTDAVTFFARQGRVATDWRGGASDSRWQPPAPGQLRELARAVSSPDTPFTWVAVGDADGCRLAAEKLDLRLDLVQHHGRAIGPEHDSQTTTRAGS